MGDNDKETTRCNVGGRGHAGHARELADWALRRVVRVSAIGTVRPVERRQNQRSDNEQQRQQN